MNLSKILLLNLILCSNLINCMEDEKKELNNQLKNIFFTPFENSSSIEEFRKNVEWGIDIDEVLKLLKLGVDINLLCGKFNRTPLMMACIHRDWLGVVMFLIENGADVNKQSSSKNTALHIACDSGHKEAVELLIKFKANVNIKDNEGKTPLHNAVYGKFPEIILILLKNGANINEVDNIGYAPINRAWNNKDKNTVKLLLDNGADIVINDKPEKFFN